MDFNELDILLKDHQTGMSDFQDDYLVTAKSGGTAYGQYKQALRETYRRFRGLRELIYGDRGRKMLDIEIDELQSPFDLVSCRDIQRGDFRLAFLQMYDAFLRRGDVAARSCAALILRVGNEVGTHAGGQVDDDIGARLAHPVDHFPEQRRVPAAFSGLRVADVDVRNGSARLGGFDHGVADLLGSHRESRMPRVEWRAAGDSAGQYDVSLHGNYLLW